MALGRNLILAFAGILLVANFGLINGNIIKDAINNIEDGIDALTCPAKYLKSYDTCTKLVYPFYVTQAAFEKSKLKLECCGELARIDCTGNIAYVMCGRNGEILSRAISRFRYFHSNRCAQYYSIGKCTNPVGLVFVMFFIVLLIVFMCKCCCCIFCRSRR